MRSRTATYGTRAFGPCTCDRATMSPGTSPFRLSFARAHVSLAAHSNGLIASSQLGQTPLGIHALISATGCSFRHCSSSMHSHVSRTSRQRSDVSPNVMTARSLRSSVPSEIKSTATVAMTQHATASRGVIRESDRALLRCIQLTPTAWRIMSGSRQNLLLVT